MVEELNNTFTFRFEETHRENRSVAVEETHGERENQRSTRRGERHDRRFLRLFERFRERERRNRKPNRSVAVEETHGEGENHRSTTATKTDSAVSSTRRGERHDRRFLRLSERFQERERRNRKPIRFHPSSVLSSHNTCPEEPPLLTPN